MIFPCSFTSSSLFYLKFLEEVTKVPSACWGSSDGTLVLYVQYNDTLVSELRYPWLAGGAPGGVASRSGVYMASVNSTAPAAFPDHMTIRYPTVSYMYGCVTVWVRVIGTDKQ